MTSPTPCVYEHPHPEHPCGQGVEPPGTPCRHCGKPVPLDGSPCPACWLPATTADFKALATEAGRDVQIR